MSNRVWDVVVIGGGHAGCEAAAASASSSAQQLLAGTRPKTALADGRDLLRRSGFTGIDYLQLCNPMDLQPTETVTAEARLLGAVHLGAVRLIDNIALGDVK